MAAPLLYARVVASFPADAPPGAVEAVVELARRLGAELQAVLLEDLATVSEMPSLRAIDPRDAVWREVQRAELLHELETAAAALRRRLEAARAAGVPAQLAVGRAAPRAVVQQHAQAGDLLVVSEPADPLARWVQPFAGLLDAALAAPAPVLYLPHRGARNSGPVVAVGGGVAAELARKLAPTLGAALLEPEAGTADSALAALLPHLRERRVRLVVCERDALGPDPQRSLQQAGDLRIAVLLASAAAG